MLLELILKSFTINDIETFVSQINHSLILINEETESIKSKLKEIKNKYEFDDERANNDCSINREYLDVYSKKMLCKGQILLNNIQFIIRKKKLLFTIDKQLIKNNKDLLNLFRSEINLYLMQIDSLELKTFYYNENCVTFAKYLDNKQFLPDDKYKLVTKMGNTIIDNFKIIKETKEELKTLLNTLIN